MPTTTGTTNSFINQVNSQTQAKPAGASTAGASATGVLTGNNQMGETQFLQMLITQLKNQDPMNPMDDNQFAVDMAQFAQVEQLININSTLSKQSSTDVNSLSAYLGKQVSYNGSSINVQSGNGGSLSVTLPQSAADVKVQILNADGSVLQTVDEGAQSQGQQTIALKNLQATDGSYQFAVQAFDAKGAAIQGVTANPSGVISGFVPGANPMLLIGSQEIKPSDVLSVGTAG